MPRKCFFFFFTARAKHHVDFQKAKELKNQWLKYISDTIPQQYNHNLSLCFHYFSNNPCSLMQVSVLNGRSVFSVM